ncbi:Cyclic nucleotide-gated cation channel alpha-3 [Fasciola gigantica]|uniref:Cyclic nucleotide-gated cation channel alpha-3 n=1 Tax=Fasciola gigantica TaxID=46835 RepID=A0A504Z0B9_FASGI|nr:Cyclic nucleotide-gated cation channel alpha-3 [Fasciola gigantica]
MTESRVSLDHPILSTEEETPNVQSSDIIVNSDQLRIEEPTKNQGDQAPWKKIRTMVRFTTMLRKASPRNYSTRRDSFIDRFTNRRPGDESSYDVHTCVHNENTNKWASAFSQQTSVNNEDNHNNSRPDQSSSVSFIDRMISGLGVKMGMTSRVMDDSSFFPFDLIPDQDRLRVLGKRPCGLPFIFQPYSLSLLIWLTVLSIAVLYNLWLPIARQAFDEFQTTNQVLFLILDIGSDLVYLMDFFVQLGTTYLECGLVVINRQKLAMRYIKSMDFRMDLISVMPLDLLQLKFGWQPMLRFPRFVKIYRARLWKVKIENRSLFPNVWRVMNSIHVLFLGCHWFACIYFMLSKYEKFSTTWGYRPSNTTFADELGRAYLKCYYWATLALTTIGIEEGPETNLE